MTRALSDKEVARAWGDLQRRIKGGDQLAARDAAVFALITWAGLKPCECATVNVEDILGNGRELAEVRVTTARQLPSVTLPGVNPVTTTRRAPIIGNGRDYLAGFASQLFTEERGAGSRPLIHRLARGEFRRLSRWGVRDCWLRAVARIPRTVTADDGRATYAVAMLAREPFQTVMEAMGITHRQTLSAYVKHYRAATSKE